MSEEYTWQSIIDDEHLKLLSIGYMISAATTCFVALLGMLYVAMGVVMVKFLSQKPEFAQNANQRSPEFVGWMFGMMGIAFMVTGVALAAMKLRAGFCIRQRRSRTFCLVVAGISCLGIPYGTLLGVFSFMVLGRESVARQFLSGATPDGITPAAQN
jgi:hypothetical protein